MLDWYYAIKAWLGTDGAPIVPMMQLALFGLGILLTDFWLEAREKYWNAVVAMAGVIFSGISLYQLYRARRFGAGFAGSVAVDPFFIFFGALFLCSAALVILLSAKYLEIEAEHHGEYYALILFATVGMMFMAAGTDLIVLFLGLETMAITFYVLVGFLRGNKKSNEGALKYLLLGAFSSGLLAYGFSLLYGVSGFAGGASTNLFRIMDGVKIAGASNLLVLGALVTISAGMLFKVAAVPFHQWAPDTYEGAPTTITTFLSVASKIASFAMLLRIFLSVFLPVQHLWELIFAAVAIATITWGNFGALTQNNLKRLLAYSSIAHAGYVLLGVVAANRTGLRGVGFYLLAYVFMNTGAFALIIMLRRKGLIGDDIEDMQGLYYRSPAAAVLLLIFMLSLAGIPPTAGFIGKYFIFLALIEAQKYLLAVVAVIYVVPALYYYFRIVQAAWMRDSNDPVRPAISPGQAAALAITGAVTLIAGLYPQPFIELASFYVGR